MLVFVDRSLKNESILKLAEDIHQQQRDEEERTRLMHELHEGRLKEARFMFTILVA